MRLLIIFFLFSQSLLLASQSEIREDFTLVVAQSGLNIRAKPGLRAKVVAKAPYLSEVEYLSDESFGRDTIGALKSFIRAYNPQMELEETDVPLTGDWVKVKYKGQTGYTFNAYLGPNHDRPEPSDYFVISPGENCGDQFFDLTKYHCYGVYGSGEETEVREIRASYVVQETGIGFLALLMTTEENESLRLVIGSKRELPTLSSDFTVNAFTAAWAESANPVLEDACKMFLVKEVMETLPNGAEQTQGFSGSFRRGGIEQTIIEGAFVYAISVIGCGDIDGDDEVDYLIGYSSEESSRKMLYLSSMSKNEEILGLACEEFFGYCC